MFVQSWADSEAVEGIVNRAWNGVNNVRITEVDSYKVSEWVWVWVLILALTYIELYIGLYWNA